LADLEKPVRLLLRAKNEKDEMKKIVNLWKRLNRPPRRTHYYHDQVLTDELEREMMKAYMGTGFRGKRF
jgi:hypothetical protein